MHREQKIELIERMVPKISKLWDIRNKLAKLNDDIVGLKTQKINIKVAKELETQVLNTLKVSSLLVIEMGTNFSIQVIEKLLNELSKKPQRHIHGRIINGQRLTEQLHEKVAEIDLLQANLVSITFGVFYVWERGPMSEEVSSFMKDIENDDCLPTLKEKVTTVKTILQDGMFAKLARKK